MKRTFFVLLVPILLAALGNPTASAQLRITDANPAPDSPRATVGQNLTISLEVTVENGDRTLGEGTIEASVPALGTPPSSAVEVSVPPRSSTTFDLPVDVDLTGPFPSGPPDEVDAEVLLTPKGGGIAERRTVTMSVVQPLVVVPGIITTIPAPFFPTTDQLHLTLVTGGDNLRGSNPLWGRVLDNHGIHLSIYSGYFGEDRLEREWELLKQGNEEWSNRSTHTTTVPLLRSVTYSEIESIELSLSQYSLWYRCIGCTDDNWDLARIEVRADNAEGTLLFEAEGDPLNRFTGSEPNFILNLGGS